MSVRQRSHRVLVAVGVALAAMALPTPASAHGAPDNPVSRAAACAGLVDKADARSAACRAAIAAGDTTFADWDNIRVADVAGRDRQVIPDGQLCSAGIERFSGLDLARADWPATRLTAGTTMTMRYRETIAHRGTFRLYVTREGYQPTRPLRWADLEARPFLTVTDPPSRAGSYRIRARLPQDRSGRHVIYTVWENSNTADTYYSCSDVVFGAPAGAAASPSATAAGPRRPAATPGPARSSVPATTPRAAEVSAAAADPASAGGQQRPADLVAAVSIDEGSAAVREASVGALFAAVLAIAALVLRRSQRRHRQ